MKKIIFIGTILLFYIGLSGQAISLKQIVKAPSEGMVPVSGSNLYLQYQLLSNLCSCDDSLIYDSDADSLYMRDGAGYYSTPHIYTTDDYTYYWEIPNPHKYDLFIQQNTTMYYHKGNWYYLDGDNDRYNELQAIEILDSTNRVFRLNLDHNGGIVKWKDNNPSDSTLLNSGYGTYVYETTPNNWVVEADTNEVVTQYDLTQITDNDTQNLSIDSLNRVFTISLENGGNVKFKDSNPIDSTTVTNTYGTIITELPANQFNIKIDSSKFATPYDLSLMELDSFSLKTSGQLRIKQKGYPTKYVNSLIYGGSSLGTNYLPVFSGNQSITNSSGTGFVKVTSGNVSYDNSTYLTSYSETDPVWTSASSNYYTKTNMQTNGQSQLHWGNLTNNPFSISSPVNNQILKYNSTTSKWENWTNNYGTVTQIATTSPLTGGPITGTGTIAITQSDATHDGYLSASNWITFNNKFTLPSLSSGSVLFSDGSTIVQNNASFFWDNTNARLGIGTTSPLSSIHSTGAIRTNDNFNLNNKYKIETIGNDIYIQPISVNGFIRYKQNDFDDLLSFDITNMRLGLGNSAPTYSLDLGIGSATNIFRITTDTKTLWTQTPTLTTLNKSGFVINSQSVDNALQVDYSTANLGLGLTPTVKLDIQSLTPVLRLVDANTEITTDQLISEVRFYSKEADGNRISGFIKSVGNETYGRKSYLSFGTSVTNNANATEQMRLHSTMRVNALDTDLSPPSTSGTTKMVISDANGDLSFATIPTSGVTGSGTPNQLAYWTSSSTLGGTSGTGYLKGNGTSFTYDNSTFLTTTLADGKILVGNAGGTATAVTMSGDATMDNTGVVSITKYAEKATNSTTQSITDPLNGFVKLVLDANPINNNKVNFTNVNDDFTVLEDGNYKITFVADIIGTTYGSVPFSSQFKIYKGGSALSSVIKKIFFYNVNELINYSEVFTLSANDVIDVRAYTSSSAYPFNVSSYILTIEKVY